MLTGELVFTLASIVSILDLGKISISNKMQDRPSKNGEKCFSTLICSLFILLRKLLIWNDIISCGILPFSVFTVPQKNLFIKHMNGWKATVYGA